MEILGLHYVIWITMILYFAAMLLMGWYSKRSARNQEGFLLGNRRFGVSMMIMHSFGAGTNPGDVAGVMSKTVSNGASGIWVSWMWMFGTPFYWLIAPIVRRMRCLTLADFFQQRYGRSACFLYILIASIGMVVFLASALLATTRTVQGMMGKADSNAWFFGLLIFSTLVFVIYGYWGGIVAAIRTDMVQGLMIIALSFLAIPAALNYKNVVGGLDGTRQTLTDSADTVNHALTDALEQHNTGDPDAMLQTLRNARPQDATGTIAKILTAWDQNNPDLALEHLQSAQKINYLSLFDPSVFNLWVVIMLCINAPLSIMSQPHLISCCAAGRTEWEGRMGFTYGNILKRLCTMGWCILGLCWLTYLIKSGSDVHPDAAFGDSVRALLNPVLRGLMLACVMAAAMSSGDAIQVTVAGLFSQNIYKSYLRPHASESQTVQITRITGIVVVSLALGIAILSRDDLVRTILDYMNITAFLGISTAMGILWRRMNSTGMFVCTIAAAAIFIYTRFYLDLSREFTIGLPMAGGILGGILGSLLTAPPRPETIEKFFTKIYVPIGREEKLDLPLDQAVPPQNRLFTKAGLFLVKPSRQSWIGFLVTLAICLACILLMLALLN